MIGKLKDSKSVYFCVTSAFSGLQFAILPLFANMLGVDEFGRYSFYMAVASWSIFFATLGAPTKIRKQLAQIGKFEQSVIVHCLVLVCVLSLVVLFVLITWCVINKFAVASIFALAIYFLSYILNQVIVSIKLGVGKMMLSAILSGVFSIMPAVLAIVFNVSAWEGRFALSFVGVLPAIYYGVVLRLSFSDVIKSLNLSRQFDELAESLKIAANSFYDKVISQGDKIVVGLLFGVETLGVYALGSQISSVVHIGMKSFSVFVEKSIFANEKTVMKSVVGIAVFGFFFGSSIYLFAKLFFSFLFDSSFLPVLNILFIQIMIVWGRIVQGLMFTLSYVSGGGWLYSMVQYITLVMVAVVSLFFDVSLKFFCELLLSSVLLGLLVNCFFYVRRER